MPKITFINDSGTQFQVTAKTGLSVMIAARDAYIQGIDADCSGACACGTCKIHVAEPWLSRLPGMEAEEKAMLDCFTNGEPGLRLSCQIEVTDALDGLVVRLPKSQRD